MATARPARSLTSYVCQSCRHRLSPTAIAKRTLTTTPSPKAPEPDAALAGLSALSNTNRDQGRRRQGYNNAVQPGQQSGIIEELNREMPKSFVDTTYENDAEIKPHRLHVLATKHNTHLTFVQAPRPASQTASSGISSTNASAQDQKKMVDVLLSLSAGNIGFRKAGRGSYDAAYQLAAFALKQIKEKGMLRDMQKLEVVMRGFGAGREAVTKVLLGSEGRDVRDRITAVVDATRLKIGGTRSPRPRRLG